MAAIIIAAVLLIVVLVFGFLAAGYSLRIRRQTLEEARAWQEAHYDLSWYDPTEKTDYTVTSYDGYVLHAQFLKNPAGTGKYILISHGYSDNRFGAMKYAKMYMDLGFNVIAYDLRGHGLNELTFCTYSARERKDLLAMILDSRQRWPDITLLGLHGESLGAATSVAVLEEKPPVDFVVADCGFSEIAAVLKGGMQASHMPGFMTGLMSLCAKIRFGYSYSDMRPVDSLKDNHIPILFVHGEKDTFVLPENSEKMKAATQGYAELHLIPGAAHADSVLTAPEAYREIVSAFLEKTACPMTGLRPAPHVKPAENPPEQKGVNPYAYADRS